MLEFWQLFSIWGESTLLIPAALLAAVAASDAARPAAWRWLCVLCAAAMLVLATKIAFMGWALGLRSLDFTGISGHAMLAAAIYPVLGFAAGKPRSDRLAWPRWVGAGRCLSPSRACA